MEGVSVLDTLMPYIGLFGFFGFGAFLAWFSTIGSWGGLVHLRRAYGVRGQLQRLIDDAEKPAIPPLPPLDLEVRNWLAGEWGARTCDVGAALGFFHTPGILSSDGTPSDVARVALHRLWEHGDIQPIARTATTPEDQQRWHLKGAEPDRSETVLKLGVAENPDAIRLEPEDFYDSYLLGMVELGKGTAVYCYDVTGILRGLIREKNIPWTEAADHFDAVVRSSVDGPNAPAFFLGDPN